MIRKHTPEDLEILMSIWLESSSMAHPFLDATFVDSVKKDMCNLYMPNSDTWVFEENGAILGFISMIKNEIGGLFVTPKHHFKGIGTQLVNFTSKTHAILEVEVFEKNEIGRAFYDKIGFQFLKQYYHEESGEEVIRLKSKK